MTTANDWIDETRAILFSGQEPEGNRLNADISNSVTSIVFKYDLGNISKGAIIAVGTEEMRVWEIDSGNKTATSVERGVNGTTAASHTALDYVEVRPKFSRFRILRALNEELADLSSPMNGLFKVATVDLTYNAARQGYDVTGATEIIDILEMRWKQVGPSRHWPLITKYDLFREMDTAEFASGFAISVYQGAQPGLPIHVRYATGFTSLASATADVSSTGLPVTAYDIPPMGAAIRLVGPREINRNFMEAQADPRRPEEVPPGAILQSTRELQRIRQVRITAEASRLRASWALR